MARLKWVLVFILVIVFATPAFGHMTHVKWYAGPFATVAWDYDLGSVTGEYELWFNVYLVSWQDLTNESMVLVEQVQALQATIQVPPGRWYVCVSAVYLNAGAVVEESELICSDVAEDCAGYCYHCRGNTFGLWNYHDPLRRR